jgi:hypothetical protein
MQVPLQDFCQAQVAHNEELIPRVASGAVQDLFYATSCCCGTYLHDDRQCVSLARGDDPLVRVIAARPGQKEKRYVQLLSAERDLDLSESLTEFSPWDPSEMRAAE